MSTQSSKDMKNSLATVIRASWFARLALGDYSMAPSIPGKTSVADPGFRQKAIDLCS